MSVRPVSPHHQIARRILGNFVVEWKVVVHWGKCRPDSIQSFTRQTITAHWPPCYLVAGHPVHIQPQIQKEGVSDLFCQPGDSVSGDQVLA